MSQVRFLPGAQSHSFLPFLCFFGKNARVNKRETERTFRNATSEQLRQLSAWYHPRVHGLDVHHVNLMFGPPHGLPDVGYEVVTRAATVAASAYEASKQRSLDPDEYDTLTAGWRAVFGPVRPGDWDLPAEQWEQATLLYPTWTGTISQLRTVVENL